MTTNANGAGAAHPDAVTNRYACAPNASTGQGTAGHRHEHGRDVDLYGWSTCPVCGYLWHPEIVTLDGARARRRLARAS